MFVFLCFCMVFWGAFWYFMEDCFGPSAFKYLYNINAVHIIIVLSQPFHSPLSLSTLLRSEL